MHLVSTAILPVVALLIGGWSLRRWLLPSTEFWRGLEWLTYHIFTPALFVSSLAGTDLGVVKPLPLVASITVPILLMTALVLGLKRALRASGPQLTSILQGSIRQNTYIGLVFASALNGALGVSTFALAAAIMVPLINVISVVALSVYGAPNAGSRRPRLWREVITNPLILGCVVGLLFGALNVRLPEFVSISIDMLAQPALVCGTLAAGAAITWRASRRDALYISFAAVAKLVALPAACGGLGMALGLEGAPLASLVVLTALPIASSSYVLAERMGGDAPLMASITGAQTVLSLVTMPVMLGLLL
ncbi:AEC family transporter [Micrococcales bacterium 31B]|nr:AEC family transporter [Micrococcales bacterium 31B]